MCLCRVLSSECISVTSCLEKCSLQSNVLYTELPVKLRSCMGTFLNSVFGYIMIILVFVLFQRSAANKEHITLSHQATFEAN